MTQMDMVLDRLQKAPATTRELRELLGKSHASGTVTMLRELKEVGVVQGREVPRDSKKGRKVTTEWRLA